MQYHLIRIDPFRAAQVAAAMYFLVGLAILPFLYFAFVMAPDGLGFSRGVVLLFPFFISGLGFASTAVACYFYNRVAARLGGFELHLHEQGPE